MRGPDKYRTVNVGSASNEQLLLQLYEKAIGAMLEAESLLEDGRLTEALPQLRIGREIFAALLSALDKDASPELFSNLSRLYIWGIRELSRAGTDGDPKRVTALISSFEELYEGWDAVLRKGGM